MSENEQNKPEQIRSHFSKERGRMLREGDYLSIQEACQVLSENRGEGINRDTASTLMARWGVKKISGPLYLYDDIRDKVVKRNRGRRLLDNPSPTALRQREFKARQRAKKMQGGQVDNFGPAILV